MDTNAGRFIPETQPEQIRPWMKRISVGEIVTLKGEVCEVVEFGERTVTLKLLSKAERIGRQTEEDRARLARAAEKRRRRAEKHAQNQRQPRR